MTNKEWGATYLTCVGAPTPRCFLPETGRATLLPPAALRSAGVTAQDEKAFVLERKQLKCLSFQYLID